MTEEVREALMRLTMCAREECAICKYKDECGFDFQVETATDAMNIILEALMERPKGKWLRKEYNFDEWVDECSVCGEPYIMIDGTATENGYNYCPNCGAYMVADMRGKICGTCKHAYTYQDQPYCDEWEEETEIEEDGTCDKWADMRGEQDG